MVSVSQEWVARARENMGHNSLVEMVETLDRGEIETYQRELGASNYTLPEVGPFMARCTKRHTFVMGPVRIQLLCRRVAGKTLRGQIVRSLRRANAVLQMFAIADAKRFTVVLVPTNRPREKPSEGDIVEPLHVNGGYTYVRGDKIYIYRLEEWPKVMLHEILHHVPELQGIRWGTAQLRTLYKTFEIDMQGCPDQCRTALEPTEAVIETWAIFLHTVFMAVETGGDFVSLLRDEISWGDHHIRWILKKKGAGEWREDTHVFSYIVLRGVLLHHLERFLAMPRPYSAADLCAIWTQAWANRSTWLGKGRSLPRERPTLRMSRYGDV